MSQVDSGSGWVRGEGRWCGVGGRRKVVGVEVSSVGRSMHLAEAIGWVRMVSFTISCPAPVSRQMYRVSNVRWYAMVV
jgi:hypothetical protein